MPGTVDYSAMKKGWNLIDGHWYYIGQDGQPVTHGWLKTSGKWCYFIDSSMLYSNLIIEDGKAYYFDASGDWYRTETVNDAIL